MRHRKLDPELLKVIGSLGQPPEIQWIRTGIHALDLMLGNGIPMGRVIEIYGDESTGKSLLGWEIAKAFQRRGGVVVVFDTEATAPKKFIERLGVRTEDLIYRKPQTIEELEKEFFLIHRSLRKAKKDVEILYLHDSVAATSSQGEWEYDKKEKTWSPKENEMASRARAMSRLTRHIALELSSSQSVYVAINQVRDKIGVMFGDKTTTPGGRGLKFHASIRLQLSRGSRLDHAGQRPYGVICNAFVKKNKVAEPFRKAPLRIIWKSGFDPFGGLAEFLEAQGRVKLVKSGIYKYKGLKFRSKDLPEVIKKNRKLVKAMY